jgi:hypothetical protein
VLTIGDFAHRATVLPCHPHRVRALFGKAAAIKDHHPVGLAQTLGDQALMTRQNGRIIPGALAQTLLPRPHRGGIGTVRGQDHRFHRLAVQVRELATRLSRLSCVVRSLLQGTPASGSETERFAFAQGEFTIGQKVRTITRDALKNLLQLVEQLLAQGKSCEPILEVLMPA